MSIKRNTAYNAAAMAIPTVVMIVTFPILLHTMGEARYGVLALIWAVFAYSVIFDLGLSGATTNAIAIARHAEDSAARRGAILWTSVTLGAAIGAAGAMLVFGVGSLTLHYWVADRGFREETVKALPFIAFAVPVILIGGVFNAVLAGQEKFLAKAMIGVAAAVIYQLSAVAAVLIINPELETVISVTVIISALAAIASGLVAVRAVGGGSFRFDRVIMRSLVGYGGWIMLSNMIAPLLTTIDQFLIGAMLGPAAVTAYAIPSSLAGRTFGLLSSLHHALFPHLSRLDREDANQVAQRAARASCVVMTGVCVVAIIIARNFLKLWLGPDIADKGGLIAEMLFTGIWINSLAYVPVTMLLSRGRPAVATKLYAVQIIPYLVLLWALIALLGIPGAALASVLRMAVCSTMFCRAEPNGSVPLGILTSGGLFLAAAFGIAEALRPGLPEGIAFCAVLGVAILFWGARIEPTLGIVALRRLKVSA